MIELAKLRIERTSGPIVQFIFELFFIFKKIIELYWRQCYCTRRNKKCNRKDDQTTLKLDDFYQLGRYTYIVCIFAELLILSQVYF